MPGPALERPNTRTMVCPACGATGFVTGLSPVEVDGEIKGWGWLIRCSDCDATYAIAVSTASRTAAA